MKTSNSQNSTPSLSDEMAAEEFVSKGYYGDTQFLKSVFLAGCKYKTEQLALSDDEFLKQFVAPFNTKAIQTINAQAEKLKAAEWVIWLIEGRLCHVRNLTEHYKDKYPCSKAYEYAVSGISEIEKFRKGAE